MIQLITGTKGTGKTKKMIEMINEFAKTACGNVVCIEKSMQHTYDIDHAVRLIDIDEYQIHSYENLYGFIAGVLAGNYDIVKIYLDGVSRIENENFETLAKLLDRLNTLTGENVEIVITISVENEVLPQEIKKYL